MSVVNDVNAFTPNHFQPINVSNIEACKTKRLSVLYPPIQAHYLSDNAFRCAWLFSAFAGASDERRRLDLSAGQRDDDGDDDVAAQPVAGSHSLAVRHDVSQTMTMTERVGRTNYHHYY